MMTFIKTETHRINNKFVGEDTQYSAVHLVESRVALDVVHGLNGVGLCRRRRPIKSRLM